MICFDETVFLSLVPKKILTSWSVGKVRKSFESVFHKIDFFNSPVWIILNGLIF